LEKEGYMERPVEFRPEAFRGFLESLGEEEQEAITTTLNEIASGTLSHYVKLEGGKGPVSGWNLALMVCEDNGIGVYQFFKNNVIDDRARQLSAFQIADELGVGRLPIGEVKHISKQLFDLWNSGVKTLVFLAFGTTQVDALPRIELWYNPDLTGDRATKLLATWAKFLEEKQTKNN